MQKKFLVAGVIVIIITTATGVVVGYLSGLSQAKPQTGINPEILKFMESKLVRDFNANILGNIVDISGESLTIEGQGVSLKLAIPKETSVYKQLKPSGTESFPPPPEKIKLGDLKTGDLVSVSLILESSGKITMANIVVLQKSGQ